MSTPYVINRFGALDVLSDSEEIGASAATSLNNVDVTERPGVLRTRDGYANFTASPGAGAYKSLYYHPSGALLAARVAGGVDVVEAIDSGGNVTGSFNLDIGPSGATGRVEFATIGTPSESLTFILPDASGSGIVGKFDGTTFTPAGFTGSGGLPLAGHLPAAWKERLATASNSAPTVLFSDAGDPLTFQANNFAEPDPGDGETQVALLTYGDLLFLFRQTKMFIFTGIGTNTSGAPIFAFHREVFGNIGSFLGCTVAQDGIYILTTKALYRTQGGPLAIISEQPRGIFTSLLSKVIPADYALLPATALQNRLYFGAPSTGSSSLDRVLVFDIATGAWMIWDIAAQSMTTSRFTVAGSLVTFGVPSKHVAQLIPGSTTDAGVAIPWQYTSGLYDPSGENRVTVTLDSSLWGTGTVTLQVANDHGELDAGSAVPLGVSPAVAQGWQQIDREGVFWQHRLSGAEWAQVSRLVHEVTFTKPAEVE